MSTKYIPLYRKYRPQTFYDLIGQEHITQALSNAIELNRISHAYLFCGPRGTGKTSSARILAKSLNCQNGPTLRPCGECPSCVDITNTTPMDVIEIDAASNRGVEDTQRIIEKIQYVPVHGKFKIYVIDEVHQLSAHSFNALLKTLEEPPANVIFILATTEPQKVLETVISRCQRFDFKRITVDDIVKRLKYISEQENINISDDALMCIAKNSAGGMRDSLSLLDQVSILDVNKTISVGDIEFLLGKISNDILLKVVDFVVGQNTPELIQLLDEIYSKGNEPTQIITNLIQYVRNLLILKTMTDRDAVRNLTQLSDDYLKKMSFQVQEMTVEQLLYIIEKLSYYLKEIKIAPNPYMWTQLCFIDLTSVKHVSYDSILERLEKLESGAVKTPLAPNFSLPPKPVVKVREIPDSIVSEQKTVEKTVIEKSPEVENVSVPKSISSSSSSQNSVVGGDWMSILENIEHTPSRVLFSSKAQPIELSAEKVVITFANDIFVMQAKDKTKYGALQKAIEKYFGVTNIPIEIRLKKDTDKVVVSSEADKKKIVSKIENEVSSPSVSHRVNPSNEELAKEGSVSNIVEPERLVERTVTSSSGEACDAAAQVDLIMDLFNGKIVE